MLKIVGLLLIAWLVLIILGAVLKGLLWLVVIGAVFFVATAAYGWVKRNDLAR